MKKIGNWFGLLISLVAPVWLAFAYDFGEMRPSLKQANYAFFLPVPVLMVVDYALRAMRWRLLFRSAAPAKLGNVFGALMIGYLFNNLLAARGAYVTCDALQDRATATTVRVRNGKTLATDGPFAETKEVLGGYYILECRDLDEAMAYAAKIPDAQYGSVEVRPIATIPGWEEAIGLRAGVAQ